MPPLPGKTAVRPISQSGKTMIVPAGIIKISDTVWELPVTFKKGMRVPARIIATENLLAQMDEGVFDQVTNVATLPGIVKYVYCMPDGH